MLNISEITEQVHFAICQSVKDSQGVVNPMGIVAEGMRFMSRYNTMSGAQKKEILMKCIETIANGKDGVQGTADDTINENIVNSIRVLLQTDLLSQTIDIISDAAKGKFDLQKVKNAVSTAHKEGCFAACFGKK